MTTEQHVFDTGGIGRWSDPVEFAVDAERAIAYAEATNDDIPAHLDGTFAPPVFAVVPPFMLLAETTMAVVPDELMLRILHGEQDFRFRRPIVPGDVLTSRAAVVGIVGKSSGVVVTTLARTHDRGGELVNEQYFTGYFRGGRWDDGAGEAPPEHTFDPALRERAPDAAVVQKFDADQTHRYAAASGDPMPIHTDDDIARQMGLPGIIVHGLCTMAFTSHALIGVGAPGHPERLTRMAVRFAKPAQPKHTITTDVWRTGAGSYAFDTTTDEGTVVITDGLAEFAS